MDYTITDLNYTKRIVRRNKSNSAAGAVRAEANLPGTFAVIEQFLLQVHMKKILDLTFIMKVKWTKHSIEDITYLFAGFHHFREISNSNV